MAISYYKKAYQKEKVKESEIKQVYADQAGQVEILAGQLSELSEALDEAKDSMQEHSGRVEDSSPVIKLKQAVKRMKEETTVLSLRIGVAKQLLVQKQLNSRREGESLSVKNTDIDDSEDVWSMWTLLMTLVSAALMTMQDRVGE